jgi:hypothetical protein
MGEYRLIYTAIASLVFVATIIGGRMFIVSNFATAEVQSAVTNRQMAATSAAYSALACLSQDGRSISQEFLEQNKDRYMCELCGLCSYIIQAKVTDLESEPEMSWEFGYSAGVGLTKELEEKLALWEKQERFHQESSVFVTIEYEEYSHLGRLDVNV